ncbi:type VII secretion protein EssA [Bacillus sp. KH172YL63]|uniref:type VII secretion protein EssA n=1 Tax=Bacillus sp. KH172YL63 TaxID=2709784 RepID=UPI0013E4557F|nr:type VII secretion protein EssA [Bacillus sp. KH172YL63]BCB06043.1 hypothetical protein KH172YL63_41760 [Bacillus sp. KH172YL63]
MKAKDLFVISVIISSMFMLASPPILANTGIHELTPNNYQEKKFKKNGDFIHDQSSTDQKVKIPDEQKNLTFKGSANTRLTDLKGNIFQSEMSDTNTIKAKAETLKLFSNAETVRLASLEGGSKSSSSLSLLISVFAGICVILLIAVMIILNKTTQGKQR